MIHRLIPHPVTPCAAVESLTVALTGGLGIIYRLRGDLSALRIPAPSASVRTDELWRHTCFEAFVAGAGEGYAEFNLSPSTAWAAYAFDAYREGMRPLDTAPPAIMVERGPDELILVATIELPADATALALTAVIEDAAGALSYWSLAHPPGKPDFHHRDCFALKLPPAGAA
jgi:hypothetical protein